MGWTEAANMDRSKKEKLMELKMMVIECLILKNKSEHVWKEFVRKNDEDWIRREGIMILLSEEVMDLMADKKEKEVREIFGDMISLTSRGISVKCSMVRLCTSVSDRVEGCVVRLMIQKCEDEQRNVSIYCVVDYLMTLFKKCKNLEMVKWAGLTGKRLWVEMKLKMDSVRILTILRYRLHSAFTRHSAQTNTETLEWATDRDWWEMERDQMGFYGLSKTNVAESGMSEIPYVKLSNDRLEARNDGLFPSPICSPFPVKSNVYFYEVICVTNEEMRLGWCTKEAQLELLSGFGNDHSVGLQIGNLCFIDHRNRPLRYPSTSRPLNVFGCLIDVENQRFEYYLNGRTIECPAQPHFTPPYFAITLLSPNQQCQVNFGQCPFKFPPQNIRFTTFHEQTGGDVKKYQLVDTIRYLSNFWLAQTPEDNKVSLFFDDEIQNELEKELIRLEGDVENDRFGQSELWGGERIYGLRGLRYIQAIIEVMGNVGGKDMVDVMAQWVGRVVENMMERVYPDKLLEFLYPYLHLVFTYSTLIQHRSICIVLLHLIKCDRHYRRPYGSRHYIIESIHSSIFTYLTRTLTSSTDQWTQLFVLIALADLEMNEHEKRQIEGCAEIRQIMQTCTKFEGKDVGQVIKSIHEHRIVYQIYICSNNLLKSITPHPNINTNPTTPTTLNPDDLTPHLTLSPCHLSARSDWHRQSVRSVCQVSAHIYYFEVVLLTAGPMTLGWATKRTDLTKITKIYPRDSIPIMVGFDEFSIGFDGFNRCIYHDNKTFQLDNIPRWKAGDIVGCLIDTNEKRFKFYLEGRQINFNPTQCPIYFSSQPYHALLSLSQFQQVYLNFGQSHFSSYRPKYIDFYDFYSNKPEANEEQTKTVVNFNNAKLDKNLISIDSNVKQGDVLITENAASNKSAALTETIGNISSVQTIANVNVEDFSNSKIKSSTSNAFQCNICRSSTPHANSRFRFDCCDHMSLCHECAPLIRKCPIHK